MEQILLPTKIEYQPDLENKNKGSVIIEPCHPGYGTTWGNALRRVLLSSLPGAAVTAVKIKGVKHEFSTIPFVKEDVLDIILNLKQLRLKLLTVTDEEIELSLKVKGEKKVYASEIEKDAQVEIVNPTLLIATLTDKKAELEMEIFVKRGRGYVPVEERKGEKKEVGKILIDSIFSPIQSVGFKVENVRVEEKTNYDRLILPIETDGSITPLEAFISASLMLTEHFNYLAKSVENLITQKGGEKKIKQKTRKKREERKEKRDGSKKK